MRNTTLAWATKGIIHTSASTTREESALCSKRRRVRGHTRHHGSKRYARFIVYPMQTWSTHRVLNRFKHFIDLCTEPDDKGSGLGDGSI